MDLKICKIHNMENPFVASVPPRVMEICKEISKAKKYIRLAQYNADSFSKDPHCKVGAIILTDDFSTILSCGINGFPRKMNDDDPTRWERPRKYDLISHAESNAVCNAARKGMALEGSVMCVTKFPCSNCTKMIIQAGIRKLYTIEPDYENEKWGEDAKISESMLEEVGIPVVKFIMDL